MQKKLDIIEKAYDFTLSEDGELLGLVAGDHCYEETGIFIDDEALKIWRAGIKAMGSAP